MAASKRKERIMKMKKVQAKVAKRKHKAILKRSRHVSEDKDIVKTTSVRQKVTLEPLKVLSDLLSPVSLSDFFETHWEKKPLILHRNNSSLYCNNLFGIEDFFNLLSSVDLKYKQHVNFCRYVNGKRINEHGSGRIKLNEAKRLWNKAGTTIQFHQPQHFKDNIWQLLTQLETVFGCLVGANVYMTPPNSQGLAPHYDDVEVIILQLEGRKHWRLYAPPISLPQDYSNDFNQDEIGSPTHGFILESGDLLYFPRGTIHQADTPPDTHSTHITISTYQHHAWTDFLHSLLPIILKDASSLHPLFREGLPLNMTGLPNGISQLISKNEMSKTCCTLITPLVTSINDMSISQALETHSLDFISSRLPPCYQSEDEIGPQGPIPQGSDKVRLCWPDYTYLHTAAATCTSSSSSGRKEEEEDCVFVYHSLTNTRSSHMVIAHDTIKPAGIRFPRHFEPAIRKLFISQDGHGILVNSLPLEDNERTQLLMSLWAEGLIAVCQ